ncbi:hypothetical protein Mapa_012441 [Marchantia paleacea]|nr:hypothetical protein Mapa_012441 [Marchantia paleacea]
MDLQGARVNHKRTSMTSDCSVAAAAAAPPPPERARSYLPETVNGSHHFTINNFSAAKGMGVGRYIASTSFAVGGHEWAIFFYPDGKNVEDNSLYVSVFIALCSEATNVQALFELALLDQSSKGRHKVHSHFNRSLESGPYTLKCRGSMWGYKRFFRVAVLEQSDYYKDDTLVLTCTVGVLASSVQRSDAQTMAEQDMGQQFGSLSVSGEESVPSVLGSRSIWNPRVGGRQLTSEAEDEGKLVGMVT